MAAQRRASQQVSRFDYSQPTKNCDIVMKGGITSGVVYPLAVCELAQTYRFKNIGGTSAGAIAAAATAAAELGRDRGGFAQLEGLPQYLGAPAPDGKSKRKQSNLFSLFQPQPETRPLFDVATAAVGHQGFSAVFRMLIAGIRSFPITAILGALPGLILAGLALWSGSGLLLAWSLLCALALILIGVVLAAAIAFLRRAGQSIPANLYGLCSGCSDPQESGSPPLTTWLTDYLDSLAGNGNPLKPLTFGDLWGTDDPEASHQIELQMMTTNLTHGRPYRLPFETDIFYFNLAEFSRLFPQKVVDWMVHKSPKKVSVDGEPYCKLPQPADLPVVVAARLSLSFPLLISAVPLYAKDRTRKETPNRDKLEPCWFSDGGISSNFPVHFFDSPLPRWPTFGINLRPFHIDYPRDLENEANNVWMPESNRSGIKESWSRFGDQTGYGRLTGFFGAILNTMQNWTDNTQLAVPGYRDRVVHVSLASDEGGANLNMPADLIDRLGERGRFAAKKLVDSYSSPQPDGKISWRNHRWVRYRTTMALLEEMFMKIRNGYEGAAGESDYAFLIGDPPSYQLKNSEHEEFARKATQYLLALTDRWTMPDQMGAASNQTFRGEDGPAPKPELRIMPRV